MEWVRLLGGCYFVYLHLCNGGVGSSVGVDAGWVIVVAFWQNGCGLAVLGGPFACCCYDVTVDLTSLNIVGTNSGNNSQPLTFLLYLGSSPTEVYSNTTAMAFAISNPGTSTGSPFNYSTVSPITLKYYSKSVNTSSVYLLATLIAGGIASAEITISSMQYTALIKCGNGGASINVMSI